MEEYSSGETLIWSNMNDPRNLDIIKKENADIKNFVPKTIIDPLSTSDHEPDYEKMYLDIINSDYKSYNLLDLIKKQSIVIIFLINKFKSVDSDKINWLDFRPGLEWVLKSSEYICGLKNMRVSVSQTDRVHRCSYKFCELKEKCYATFGDAFTNNKTDKPCNNDHFVHNKVVQDITCLIAVFDKTNEVTFDDLRLGLTTLDFVIQHMAYELDTICTVFKYDRDFNPLDYYKIRQNQMDKSGDESIEDKPQKYRQPSKYKKHPFKPSGSDTNPTKFVSNRYADLMDT